MTERIVSLIVGVTQVFSNSRVLVFLNALEKLSASIARNILLEKDLSEQISGKRLDAFCWKIKAQAYTFKNVLVAQDLYPGVVSFRIANISETNFLEIYLAFYLDVSTVSFVFVCNAPVSKIAVDLDAV